MKEQVNKSIMYIIVGLLLFRPFMWLAKRVILMVVNGVSQVYYGVKYRHGLKDGSIRRSGGKYYRVKKV